MSDDSPILSMPLILPAQAQKHVTHNEALRILDIVVQLAVIDRTRTTPPAGPAEGDRHIIAPGATGDWAGRSGQIACFWGGAWAFVAPRDGWTARVTGESLSLVHDNGQWVAANPIPQQLDRLGINTGADASNRLAISAPATLLTHDGAGHQLKINKANTAATASLLFQTGWQGRAEMGLAGEDGFSVKVSADGSQWHTALVTDPATGAVTLPKPLRLGGQATNPANPPDGTLWLHAPTGEVRLASGGTVQPLGLPDGPRGDITVSANGTTWAIAPASVTNAQMAPLAAPGIKGSLIANGEVMDLPPAQVRDMLALAPLAHTDFCDVGRFGSTATMVGPFIGAAVVSGTVVAAIPAAAVTGINPYGSVLRCSATGNGGYRFSTGLNSDYLGVTSRKFRLKALWRTPAGSTVRLGFHNATTVTDTTHGAYFEVLGDQITAKTAAAGLRTTHPTTLTLTSNVFYTFDIEADAPTNAVRFRVWEGTSPSPIMDVQIDSTLPTSAATPFGAGIVATNSQTVVADILILYEIAIGTIAGFRRQID